MKTVKLELPPLFAAIIDTLRNDGAMHPWDLYNAVCERADEWAIPEVSLTGVQHALWVLSGIGAVESSAWWCSVPRDLRVEDEP